LNTSCVLLLPLLRCSSYVLRLPLLCLPLPPLPTVQRICCGPAA
jgi:hypothetical protein